MGELKSYMMRLKVFLHSVHYSVDYDSPLCYTISMRIGRPTIPAKQRQSHLIALRLKPAEYKVIAQAAAKARLSVSEYIRQTLGLR